MHQISVIIPARNEPYLQQTLDSVTKAAHGAVQVVVALDGYWPDPQIKESPTVTIFHSPVVRGMRASINAAAELATGQYLLKLDAHCILAPDFVDTLIMHADPSRVLVPQRRTLNAETWTPGDIDRAEFQYIRQDDLKGKNWPEYESRVIGQVLPKLMTMQGSCWFMAKETFIDIGGLDAENYGSMGREAQEICLKTWLSGRSLHLCRATWYAHWSKDKGLYPGMGPERSKSEAFANTFWKNDQWPKAIRSLKSLISEFAPVPTWDGPQLPQVQPNPAASKDTAVAQSSTPTKPVAAKAVRKDPIASRMGGLPPFIWPGMNRTGLYRHFASLGFTKGAEVGVFLGANAKTMFRNIPGLHLHLVEPHADYPFSSRHYGSRLPKIIDRANRRLRNRNCTWHKMISEEAAREVPDLSLDFVYIDGDHTYDFCMLDIILWFRKVRAGGIISGHDYFLDPRKERHAKVSAAVNDYMRIHRIDPWYITDTSAAQEKGDKYASWFFTKQTDRWPNQ